MEIPETIPFETAEEYRKRCREEIQTMQAASKRKRDKEYAEHRERMAKERVMQRKAIAGELESARYISEKESKSLISALENAREKKNNLESWVKMAEGLTGQPIQDINEKLKRYDIFQKNLEIIKEYNPEKAEKIEEMFSPIKETVYER